DARFLRERLAVDFERHGVFAERRELIDDARGVAAAGAAGARAGSGAARPRTGATATGRDADVAGAASTAAAGSGRAGRPDDGVDTRGRATLEPRNLLAAAVGDRDRGIARGRLFDVVADQDAVRLVRRLDVALAEEVIVGAELPRDALDGRLDREEVDVLRE